jgi:predicted enzyme related to lactoylglutathione lyase
MSIRYTRRMAKITGVGGVFFKARDPKKLGAWYKKHLGIPFNDAYNMAILEWREDRGPDKGQTVWALADKSSKWFKPSAASFMINYRVDGLDAMLKKLKKGGVKLQQGPESHEHGKFAWLLDPEGNRVELWEPNGK